MATLSRMVVPISGQVTGTPEADNLMDVALSGHYAAGKYSAQFEREFAQFMGQRHAILVNSGSSANLLALAALELPQKSLIATTALNFPTTVNAIYQLGHIPLLVDSDPKTLTMAESGWELINYFDAKAVIIAHTLGNPQPIPEQRQYYLIEDCCDAVGSTIDGKMVGQLGDMASVSFYPAHHITMGEGGAVLTNHPYFKKVVESLRDWGRDCWCEPGADNTCGTRFSGDYDHKYTYSRIGYNLKATDLQAAVGVAQLGRLQGFIDTRKANWQYLHAGLSDLPLEIVEPTEGSDPSWFGFAFMTPERNRIARQLAERGIGNRPIMGGNLLRQPAYKNRPAIVLDELKGTNKVHEQGLWIGVWPGLSNSSLDYVIEVMHELF